MKRTVRKNVFETNSSSVHTLILAHGDTNVMKVKLEFEPGEYGWGPETLTSCFERADYLWTFLYNAFEKDPEKMETIKGKIQKILGEYGIECVFNAPKDWWCYIDHYTSWYNDSPEDSIFYKMLDDENTLIDYLFNDNTKIYIDNDNNYEADRLNIKHPDCQYEEYVKRN